MGYFHFYMYLILFFFSCLVLRQGHALNPYAQAALNTYVMVEVTK